MKTSLAALVESIRKLQHLPVNNLDAYCFMFFGTKERVFLGTRERADYPRLCAVYKHDMAF